MNNEQFRRLIQDNTNPSTSPSLSGNKDGSTVNATPATALGSRMRSSIPMTPRSLTTPNFARQLADYRREGHHPPTKRFKSSAAPKGTKLPTGYQDRTHLRQSQDDDSAKDIETRINALEEMVKEGKIDAGMFEKLRGELGVGGDVGSTHMVKGLDWELLRRVRAGEDVSKGTEKDEEEGEKEEGEKEGEGEREEGDGAEEEVDLEAEFERVTEEKGQEDIAPVAPKEKEKKKGTMAPPPAPAQAQAQAQKKSRDEILRQLRASRAAPAAEPAPPPESTLGSKFKKLGESRPEKKRWVETDENGRRREVLLTTDAQGNTKRKTRWLDKPGESNGLLVPDKDAKPLGMEVPAEVASKAAAAAAPVEDEDDDIFEGVGADYNPLADIGEDDSSSDSDEEGQVAEKAPKKTTEPAPPSTEPIQPSRPRNYFSTSTHDEPTEEDEDRARANPLTRDPSLLAALKRAAALRQASPSAGGDEEKKDDSRGQRFLEEMRRREAQDAMDMDMGFGGSRIEDEEDEEFIGLEGDGGRGGQKRKRGPKKRKGDKENASDVMGVLESRK